MPDERPVVLHARVVTGTGGGPEKTIFNSSRYLREFGYEVLCAYMYPPGDAGFDKLREKAAAVNAALIGIEDRGPFDLCTVRRMLALCREHRVTIWHAHDYKSNLFGILLRRFWPMHLVTTVHGWVERTWRTPLYYWIDKHCLRHYERVLCVSEDIHHACLRAKVLPEHCLLVENAIDTEQFSRKISIPEAKRRLGFDPQRLLIGSVGRLSAEKNFSGLIQVVAQLIRDGAALDLAVVGDGNQRQDLNELIQSSGVFDHVRLLGYRADMIDLYQAFDLFVSNSLREGLPNVLLEAMAMEVPVIATRIAGIPTLLDDGVSGLVIPPNEPAALGVAINQLIANPCRRQFLAAAARGTILDKYSFSRRMEKIHAIYRSVLGGKPL